MSCIELWKPEVLVMDYRRQISLPVLGVGGDTKNQMCLGRLDGCLDLVGILGAPQMQPSLTRLSCMKRVESKQVKKKKNQIRSQLEVQICCQMLRFRLSFEPVPIQTLF